MSEVGDRSGVAAGKDDGMGGALGQRERTAEEGYGRQVADAVPGSARRDPQRKPVAQCHFMGDGARASQDRLAGIG